MCGMREIQVQECLEIQPCDANCKVGQWEPWSSCSVECLNTTNYNFPSRSCKRIMISAAIGDGLCLPLTETDTSCPNITNCRIDGEWSEWSKSETCDQMCGNGTEVLTRQCLNQSYGGETCPGELEKNVTCFQGHCLCELTEWSEWSNCIALQNGCGNGTKSRNRTKKEEDIDCVLQDGQSLEEEENCFTKHCTNEFFTMNKITIEVDEADYPGLSEDWKIVIKDARSGEEWCSTQTVSDLKTGSRKIISGSELGKCGFQDKFSRRDFKMIENLTLQIKPAEEPNSMSIHKLEIYNCNYQCGGSWDDWTVEIPGYCKTNFISIFYNGNWKTIT